MAGPAQMEFFFMGRARMVQELDRKSVVFSEAARSECTRRGYASDWRIFEGWCADFGRSALPAAPETVRLFLVAEAGRWSVATVCRRVAAVAARHRAQGLADPTKAREVVEVMCGLRRSVERGGRGKDALTVAELVRMVRAVRKLDSPFAERDAALLLVGFAGGFRRSELVSLELRDVRLERRGALVMLRRGKTDQEGRGRLVAIPRAGRVSRCPVAALEAWLLERGSRPGALFCRLGAGGRVLPCGLTGAWIWHVVRDAAAAAGLDASRFGAHSLRAGLVTAAHERGRSDVAIMQTTGHRRVETLAGYVRKAPGRAFLASACAGLL